MSQMKEFERNSTQHAVWKGKVTGTFLHHQFLKNLDKMKYQETTGHVNMIIRNMEKIS